MQENAHQWTPDVVCYHDDEDGFGGAWLAWMTIANRKDGISYVPCNYGTPLTYYAGDWAGANVLFVDFAPKKPDLEAMFSGDGVPNSVVILDHHKTAMAELEAFTFTACGGTGHNFNGLRADLPGMFQDCDELRRPPILAFFDMEKAGARIAMEFCGLDTAKYPHVAEMVKLIEDRDLWRFNFGSDTRHFFAAIQSYERDFIVWDTISQCIRSTIEEGKHISRAHDKNVRDFCANAYHEKLGDYIFPAVNVPWRYASDCAHRLLDLYPDAPFSGAWFLRGDGKVQWSLRSENSRLDVSEIAKTLGGGGHRNAAGFEIHTKQGWTIIDG